MLVKAMIAGVITLAVIGTTAQIIIPPRPIILYNPSPSAPIGFYKLSKDEAPKSGVQVAAYAPEWARKMADERGYLPYDYPLKCHSSRDGGLMTPRFDISFSV